VIHANGPRQFERIKLDDLCDRFAAEGMAASLSGKANDAVVAAFADPAVKETMAKQGNTIQISTTEQAQAGDPSQALDQDRAQGTLASMDGRPVEPHHPVQCRGEADSLRDRRRAGFEALRRSGPGGQLRAHLTDHAAAAHERRQCREQLLPAPQHADAPRTEALVAGEGKEIHAQRPHVLRPMLHRLRTVE